MDHFCIGYNLLVIFRNETTSIDSKNRIQNYLRSTNARIEEVRDNEVIKQSKEGNKIRLVSITINYS